MALALGARKASCKPIAIAPTSTIEGVAGAKKTKRVSPEAHKAFSRFLERFIEERYGGNQTAAAKAIGVTQGHISAMILGNRGPGLNTLLELRLATGMTIDSMLGFAHSPDEELKRLLEASVLAKKNEQLEQRVQALEVASSKPPLLPRATADVVLQSATQKPGKRRAK